MVGKATTRPTAARPGTAEKVDILTERAAAGENLFHPEDGRI
jgi:hypothetical protein